MLKTLKRTTALAATGLFLALAACNAPGPTGTNPSTSPSGTPATGTASMAGSVTKDGTAPGKNASIVLILKKDGKDGDAQIVRTKDNGSFSFDKVEKGNYRVAFTLATEQQRKDKSRIMYDPADSFTSDYYSFVTTASFDYDGDASKTFQVPTYNVGWKSNLKPYNETVDSKGDIKFSWSAASGAKSYNVLIQDDNGNQVSKSPETTDTTWTLTSADSKLSAGKTYYYLVNVTFDSSGPDPKLTYGGSSLSKFMTK